MISLGILGQVRLPAKQVGQHLDDLLEQEEEPGLGGGGLVRLAGCHLESLATLEHLGVGYGLRYEFGIFNQEIRLQLQS
jgi:starch phosphorylase